MKSHYLKVFSAAAVATGAIVFKVNQSNTLKAEGLNQNALNHISQLQNDKTRVAVIGSGIGAASTVYFLRKKHGSTLDIEVFEKSDKCGGRLKTVNIKGQETEAGGTYILETHKYMMEFFKETDSEMNVLFTDLKLGIWNGEKINPLGMINWTDKIMMAWKFGPFNLMNLDKVSKFVGDSFHKIYEFQDNEKSFETVPELLEALDPSGKLLEYSRKSCDQAMAAEGIGPGVVSDLINPIIRWNLGQNSDHVNGLTGFLIAAGGKGYLWNFKGGNSKVCTKVFEMSDAKVHYNSKVSRIEKSTEHNKTVYHLYGNNIGEEVSINGYDVVVVSAPIEVPSAYIEYESCPNWPKPKELGCYQKRVANFIQGEVKPEAFGSADDPAKLPGLILTTKCDGNNFDTIIHQYNLEGEPTAPKVHLVFTQEPFTPTNAAKLFNFSFASITSVSWLACPRYVPQEKFIPFRLDSGVFYLSPMERVKAGMEMAAISGCNAALLIDKYLKSKTEN